MLVETSPSQSIMKDQDEQEHDGVESSAKSAVEKPLDAGSATGAASGPSTRLARQTAMLTVPQATALVGP